MLVCFKKNGRAPHTKKKVGQVFALKDSQNSHTLLDDPGDIVKNAELFYGGLYNTRDPLPHWIRDKVDEDFLTKIPVLKKADLRILISEMPKGKQARRIWW